MRPTISRLGAITLSLAVNSAVVLGIVQGSHATPAQTTLNEGSTQQIESALLQVEGELNETDEVVPQDNSFYDLHTFEGQAGQTVLILMESQEFDTFLWLFAPDGEELAQNDDYEGATTDSAIALTLPQSGTYTICANAHSVGMQGTYTVTVRQLPEAQPEAQ